MDGLDAQLQQACAEPGFAIAKRDAGSQTALWRGSCPMAELQGTAWSDLAYSSALGGEVRLSKLNGASLHTVELLHPVKQRGDRLTFCLAHVRVPDVEHEYCAGL